MILFLLCLVQVSECVAQSAEDAESQAYQKIYEGNILMDKGLYEPAIAAYQEATTLVPNDPKPYYYMSFLYAELGRLSEAKIFVEKALQIWPLYPEAHALLGAIYLQNQAFERAFSELNFAITQKYEQPSALNNLGGYYLLHKNNMDSAIYFFCETVRLDSAFSDAYINLSNAYLHKKAVADAMIAAQKALQLSPENPDVYFSLANAYFLDGKYEEAEKLYRKTANQDSSLIAVHYNLGRALLANEKMDESQKECDYLRGNGFIKLSELLQEEISEVRAMRLK
ncbi:tetratricopeptide repeat protein [Chloroherpeton thalassium]|nr:tetratricopeptide repeat protein [Chloroherpeton thalassium]